MSPQSESHRYSKLGGRGSVFSKHKLGSLTRALSVVISNNRGSFGFGANPRDDVQQPRHFERKEKREDTVDSGDSDASVGLEEATDGLANRTRRSNSRAGECRRINPPVWEACLSKDVVSDSHSYVPDKRKKQSSKRGSRSITIDADEIPIVSKERNFSCVQADHTVGRKIESRSKFFTKKRRNQKEANRVFSRKSVDSLDKLFCIDDSLHLGLHDIFDNPCRHFGGKLFGSSRSVDSFTTYRNDESESETATVQDPFDDPFGLDALLVSNSFSASFSSSCSSCSSLTSYENEAIFFLPKCTKTDVKDRSTKPEVRSDRELRGSVDSANGDYFPSSAVHLEENTISGRKSTKSAMNSPKDSSMTDDESSGLLILPNKNAWPSLTGTLDDLSAASETASETPKHINPMDRCIVLIQGSIRRHLAYQQKELRLKAVYVIQAYSRRWLVHIWTAHVLRQQMAAHIIQAFSRKCLSRRCAARVMQCHIRGWLAKRHLVSLRKAACTIQVLSQTASETPKPINPMDLWYIVGCIVLIQGASVAIWLISKRNFDLKLST